MKPIDPIVIRERRKKLGEIIANAHTAEKGAGALEWFGTHAFALSDTPGTLLPNRLDASNKLAGNLGQEGWNVAQNYVHKAAVLFREQVLAKAIELAQADFDVSKGKGD